MTIAPRLPFVGERVRVRLDDGSWSWAKVTDHFRSEKYGAGFGCTCGLFRHLDDYGRTWRFWNDDPRG